MDSFKVKTNSWHYRFLTFMDQTPQKTCGDFCSYWRLFIAMACVFAFLVAVGCALVVGTILGPIWTLFSYYALDGQSLTWTMAGVFIWSVVFFVCAGKNFGAWCQRRHDNALRREPGLFITRYRSWKEKFCPAIEYLSDE